MVFAHERAAELGPHSARADYSTPAYVNGLVDETGRDMLSTYYQQIVAFINASTFCVT